MVKGVGRPGKPLVLLLCVIAALVLVSLVVVLTRGRTETTRCLHAGRGGAGLCHRRHRRRRGRRRRLPRARADSRCEEFESVAPERNIRVALVSTTQRETTADVVVSISYTNVGGPFGSPEYASEESFDLSLAEGKWLISNAPWPLLVCPNKEIAP